MKTLPEPYELLILCARAQGNPAQYERLKEAAASLQSWDSLAHLAELHGIAPLVYTHLQAAQITLPESTENDLKAHYLRHTHANHIRTRALVEILKTFQAADIQALVLKGMAQAHLVYPHPRLRPMSDIDLLVRKGDAQQAQAQLKKLGFSAQAPNKGDFEHHHLPVARRYMDGVSLYVEIHHNLHREQSAATNFEALSPNATPFMLEDINAYALGYKEMLAHTYQHLVDAPFQSFRLIWIADIVSLVEGFGEQIERDSLPPRIENALKAIMGLTPFNLPGFEKKLPVSGLFPSIASQLQGWPFTTTPAQNQDEYLRNISAALHPSAWWLRFFYGLPPQLPLLGARLWHPLYLLAWSLRYRGLSQITRRLKARFR
jgi:hypothetical protein